MPAVNSVPMPFRVGATSYVIPADILPNVEFLAPLVDDVELVLFETDEHGSNLPDESLRARLRSLAEEHDLTYTVHLPLDLRLGDDGGLDHVSLIKARRVIDSTRELDPYAYTMHLDGTLLLDGYTLGTLSDWLQRSHRVLSTVCGWLDHPQRLCIENVEGWDPEVFAPLLDDLPVSRVVDVGHLWLQNVDPLEHLDRWMERTRVIHLHGIAARDHSSLAVVEPSVLDPVVSLLARAFGGVLTLEVFTSDDFTSSREALEASLRRVGGEA